MRTMEKRVIASLLWAVCACEWDDGDDHGRARSVNTATAESAEAGTLEAGATAPFTGISRGAQRPNGGMTNEDDEAQNNGGGGGGSGVTSLSSDSGVANGPNGTSSGTTGSGFAADGGSGTGTGFAADGGTGTGTGFGADGGASTGTGFGVDAGVSMGGAGDF